MRKRVNKLHLYLAESMALLAVFFFISTSYYQSTPYISLNDYIDKYKGIAIMEMQRTGIPASITLAQGIIESNYGNSTLAMGSNNHFGIKCRNWQGASTRLHDDKPNECFRKYEHPYESFIDHSYFLCNSERYKTLFNYSPTDYRSWAQGLQKAHYASSKRYARIISSVIEFYGLHYYDTSRYQKYTIHPVYVDLINKYQQMYLPGTTLAEDAQTIPIEAVADTSSFTAITQLMSNSTQIPYTVQPGETLYSIARKFNTTIEMLQSLNMLPNTQLKAGQILYVISP